MENTVNDDWQDSDASIKLHLCIDAFVQGGKYAGSSYADPAWSEVERYLELVYQHGGEVALDYRRKKYDGEYFFDQVGPSGLKRLWVQENGGRYVLAAFFERRNSPEYALRKYDPMSERRWWEPEGTPYRGEMRWYDHPYDARSFCGDVNVAKRIFKDVFDNGTLTEASLKEMRDGDYKPPT
jgi:hypothetical protein